MRWKVKPKEYSDIRRRKKFLLLPATVNGETRWLETVYVEERLMGDMGSMGGPTWQITCFLDEENCNDIEN